MDGKSLIDELLKKGYSMVERHNFDYILKHQERIAKTEGDIVECGTWLGGFGIFLALTFPEKRVWICDSFNGFQPVENGLFEYKGSTVHTPDYDNRCPLNRFSHKSIKAPIDVVRKNFEEYGLVEGERIKFVKGYVKDTLPTTTIEKIALLRVDVDAYSATREVLTFLYPKVVSDGIIVFDDTSIRESIEAIQHYFSGSNCETFRSGSTKPMMLYNPITEMETDVDSFGIVTGGYLIKP